MKIIQVSDPSAHYAEQMEVVIPIRELRGPNREAKTTLVVSGKSPHRVATIAAIMSQLEKVMDEAGRALDKLNGMLNEEAKGYGGFVTLAQLAEGNNARLVGDVLHHGRVLSGDEVVELIENTSERYGTEGLSKVLVWSLRPSKVVPQDGVYRTGLPEAEAPQQTELQKFLSDMPCELVQQLPPSFFTYHRDFGLSADSQKTSTLVKPEKPIEPETRKVSP